MFRADNNTGRFQPHLSSVGAVVALGGCVTVRIDIERVIRAGLHARFAPNTASGIKINNAIGTLVQCFGRADSHARRVIAVIAASDEEIASCVRKFAFFDILDPGTIDTDRNIMLGFTGDCTGMTANTLALIDDKSVFGHVCFLLLAH
jgi:hypothetical protein